LRIIILMLFMCSSIFGKSFENKRLYNAVGLKNKIKYSTFKKALKGYKKVPNKREEVLAIVDYSKPSTKRRFFVIDLAKKRLIYYTYVAHGINSGKNHTKKFSNKPGSEKSSQGFFKTGETYSGEWGYSLRLDGLEAGINDRARYRGIVIHGQKEITGKTIPEMGRLFRTAGCPGLPLNENRAIINYIKGGSVLFVNSGKLGYKAKSKMI